MTAGFFDYRIKEKADYLFLIGSFCNTSFVTQVYSCFWMIGAERLIATIKKGKYEHSQDARALVFAEIITWGYSLLTAISWHVFELGDTDIFIIIMWTIYGITLLLLIILYFVNRRLSKIYYNSTIQLSERYQIYENRRAMNYVMPHILLVSIGVLLSVCCSYFFDKSNVKFTMFFHSLVIDILVTVAILYSFIVSKKKKIINAFQCFLTVEKREESSVVQNARVDPMGKPVIIKERGADLHFNQLKKAWT